MASEREKWIEAGQFLTDKERSYLHTGNAKYESQTRYRIRQKTAGALADLATVGANLSNKDAAQLFDGAGKIAKVNKQNGDKEIDPGHTFGVSGAIALGFQGHKLNGSAPEQFVSLVENGIRKGMANAEGVHPSNVVVDLELNDLAVYSDTDEMAGLEKIEKGLGLTPQEWQQVGQRLKQELDRESIPFDEVPELAREHLLDGHPHGNP